MIFIVSFILLAICAVLYLMRISSIEQLQESNRLLKQLEETNYFKIPVKGGLWGGAHESLAQRKTFWGEVYFNQDYLVLVLTEKYFMSNVLESRLPIIVKFSNKVIFPDFLNRQVTLNQKPEVRLNTELILFFKKKTNRLQQGVDIRLYSKDDQEIFEQLNNQVLNFYDTTLEPEIAPSHSN
ncbi:MAG: hypothetical protein AB8B53_08580 [Flavobacteriales bacterium]